MLSVINFLQAAKQNQAKRLSALGDSGLDEWEISWLPHTLRQEEKGSLYC